MEIVFLGTGTPDPTVRRASSGFLVELNGQLLQFDCGGGTFGRLLQANYSPTDVDILLLSHLHSDHMMDYARLVHARWDQGAGRVEELRVHAPRPFARMSESLFGRDGVFAADLSARCEHPASKQVFELRGGVLPRQWPAPQVQEFCQSTRLSGPGWIVSTTQVPHVQPYLDCYAFRLETSSGALVYSGDSGTSSDFTRLAKNADILIHMCFQLSSEDRCEEWRSGSSGHLEVARCASEAEVRSLYLTHLPPRLNDREVQDQARREMSAIYDGEIVFAEDLMRLSLPGSRVP